jgi:hypothetical protein
MKNRIGVAGFFGLLAVAAVAGLCASTSVLACGDKFLVVGRGARFQRASGRDMSVLLYAPASSTLSGEFGKRSVDGILTRAGYRPFSAASVEQLDALLKSRGQDIVLVDIADAQTVAGRGPAGSPEPVIIPVLDKATRQEVADARKKWGVALKCPVSGDALLDAVDEAAQLRAKRKTADPKR